MAKPLTAPKRGLLTAELAKSKDLDLPARDKPSRTEAGIVKGAKISFGYGGHEVEVLGPGRGAGWIYVGWLDDDLNPCLGQVHKDQLLAPPPVVEAP